MTLLAQTTQPTSDLPNWAVATLIGIAGVVAVLTSIKMLVLPLVKDLIKQVVEAVAEARSAKASTDASQQSMDRLSAGLRSANEKIADVATKVDPNGPNTLRCLLPLLLALPLFVGGCLPVTATDYDRLYAAKQAYQTSGTVFEAAIDAKVIKNKEQARPIQAARDAAKAVLDDADAKLKAGDKLGFNFALDEFNVALGKFRQYLARSNVPDPAPTPVP